MAAAGRVDESWVWPLFKKVSRARFCSAVKICFASVMAIPAFCKDASKRSSGMRMVFANSVTVMSAIGIT